jgi:hypothetical protein
MGDNTKDKYIIPESFSLKSDREHIQNEINQLSNSKSPQCKIPTS